VFFWDVSRVGEEAREVVKNYIFLDYFPEKGLEAHFLRVRV
jgi:hypothetical protein